MNKHLDIFVFGDVQGVGFRHAAKQIADNLEIKGYARNEGKFVFIEAEGTEGDLDNFIEWCNSGPDSAKVERIDFKEGHLKTFQGIQRFINRACESSIKFKNKIN